MAADDLGREEQERLRRLQPKETQDANLTIPSSRQVEVVVYVDVDDTLVRWASTKRIPIPRSIERVRSLHAEGAVLYLWSTGGAEYARSVATDLGIADCFTGFLPKPTLIIDDQAVQDWRDCKHEYPI